MIYRRFMLAAATGCVLFSMPVDSRAQDYPNDTITIVVSGSAGSGSDVVGRIIADGMSKALGTSVVVENRPGGGGTVAGALVAGVAPDGYTILQLNLSLPAAETLYPDRGYDLVEDFDQITRFASSFYIFVVPPSLEATSLTELIALAKSKPGALNYAAASKGTASHLVTELFKSKAGLDIVHIPYNGGGPATTAALAGEVDFYGSPYATGKPLVEEGKLRPLAVTSAERAPDLPDVPAVAEFVPGFEFTAWYGLSVPKGTPDDVRKKLYEAVRQAISDPAVTDKLGSLGYTPIQESPEQFAEFLKSDIQTISDLIKASGVEAP